MSSDSIKALKKMVKDRINPEESRNALLQLLKRGAIEPDEVMEFVDSYQEAKKLKQPIDMPQTIKFYAVVNYGQIKESIEKGWHYTPMNYSTPYFGQNADEVFEIDLPLNGFKQITAKKVEEQL